jgi:protein-S-isoprenylcysteine O-methyltransferase Ste14
VVFDDGSEAHVARVLVVVQVGLLGAQALLRRRQDWPTPTGLRVAAGLAGAAGVAVMVGAGRSLGPGLTASPLPNARAELRTDGLYRHVRHPIYSAVLLLSVARTVASGDARQAAVSIALGSLLYGKSSFEERALARRFPDYPAYAARTPRFVPRMLAAPDNAAATPADSP